MIASPGATLDLTTREPLKRHLGHDFSKVRIHADTAAADSARMINALAYTVGNHVVFGAGRYAPGTFEGRALLAHELTHVVQDDDMGPVSRSQLILGSADDPAEREAAGVAERTARSVSDETVHVIHRNRAHHVRVVRRLLIYGTYDRPYKDDASETKSVERGTWAPSSVDYEKTADGSGGGQRVRTFDELLARLAEQPAGSIGELGLIGHANRLWFSLAGTVKVRKPPDVEFTEDGVIDPETIDAKAPKVAAAKSAFAPGARVILYGCHAGVGADLLNAIDTAFGVCTKGFSEEVLWCLQWRHSDRSIWSRGRTYVDSVGLVPLGLVPCSDYHANIHDLVPDSSSASCGPKGG